MKLRWIVYIVTLLMLSLGCSLLNPQKTPESGAPVQPTAKQEDKKPGTPTLLPTTSAEGTAEEEAAPTIDTDGLKNLNSYRMKTVWRYEGEDGTVEEFNIQQEATRDPRAERYVITSPEGSTEFIRIGETQWMRFGEEWMQSSINAGDELSGFGYALLEPDQFVNEVNADNFTYLGKETIKGIATRHYRLKENVLDAGWYASATEIKESAVEIWIADEKNLPKVVVRYGIEVVGTFEEQKKGKVYINSELYDINQPITIEPPAAAADMGLPGGLELCPDASNLLVTGNMTFFSCAGTFEETSEFYTEMLKNAGWEATDVVNETPGVWMGTWIKDNETLNLTINANQDTGEVSVMITLGE